MKGELIDAEECLKAAFASDVRPAIRRNGGRARDWRKIRCKPSAPPVTRSEPNVSAGRRIKGPWPATREDPRHQHGPRINARIKLINTGLLNRIHESALNQGGEKPGTPLRLATYSLPMKNNHVSVMMAAWWRRFCDEHCPKCGGG
jgi:hypothetical protein